MPWGHWPPPSPLHKSSRMRAASWATVPRSHLRGVRGRANSAEEARGAEGPARGAAGRVPQETGGSRVPGPGRGRGISGSRAAGAASRGGGARWGRGSPSGKSTLQEDDTDGGKGGRRERGLSRKTAQKAVSPWTEGGKPRAGTGLRAKFTRRGGQTLGLSPPAAECTWGAGASAGILRPGATPRPWIRRKEGHQAQV